MQEFLFWFGFQLEEMSSSDLPPPIPIEAALILDKEGFKIPPPPPLGELPKPAASTNPPPGPPTKPESSQRSNPPPGFTEKSLFSSDEREKPEASAEPPAKKMKGMVLGKYLSCSNILFLSDPSP